MSVINLYFNQNRQNPFYKNHVFHLATVKFTSVSLIFLFVLLCSKDLLFQVCLLKTRIFIYRSKSSQRLISHDIHSNVYNYKSTFSVEIVPICKVASLCFIFRVFCSTKKRGGSGNSWDLEVEAILWGLGNGEGSTWEMQKFLEDIGWENENMMKNTTFKIAFQKSFG